MKAQLHCQRLQFEIEWTAFHACLVGSGKEKLEKTLNLVQAGSAWILEGHLERGFCSKQLPATNVFMALAKEAVVSHVCFAAAVHHTFLWRLYNNEA